MKKIVLAMSMMMCFPVFAQSSYSKEMIRVAVVHAERQLIEVRQDQVDNLCQLKLIPASSYLSEAKKAIFSSKTKALYNNLVSSEKALFDALLDKQSGCIGFDVYLPRCIEDIQLAIRSVDEDPIPNR